MEEKLIVIGDKVKLDGILQVVNKPEIADEETGKRETWYTLKLEGWDYEIAIRGEKDLRLCGSGIDLPSDACKII